MKNHFNHFLWDVLGKICPMSVSDAEGQLLRVNEKFEALTLQDEAQLLGQLNPLFNSPEILDAGESFWQSLKTEDFWKCKLSYAPSKGSKQHLETSVIPFTHEDIPYLITVSFSITEISTELSTSQVLLAHQKIINQVLLNANHHSLIGPFLNNTIDLILSAPALSILPRAGIFLTGSEGGLVLTAQKNLHPKLLVSCKHIALGHCLCGRAAQSGELIFKSDLDHEHEIRYDGISDHGHYNVPIKSEDEVLGVLVVYLPPGHHKDELEINFLTAIASTIALVLKHKFNKIETLQVQQTSDQHFHEKTELLAYINHDLRAPLTSIIGYNEIAIRQLQANQFKPEEISFFLKKIQNSSEYMRELVDQISEFSQLDSGHWEPQWSEFNFPELLNFVYETCEILALKKGLKISLSNCPPSELRSDRQRLQQILMNLMSNAIQNTNQGEIRLECQQDEKGQLEAIHVKDTGVGISEADQATIFQAYKQGQEKTGKTGLGLAISHLYCQKMGYELKLESTLGQGSCFTIVIKPPHLSSTPAHESLSRSPQ